MAQVSSEQVVRSIVQVGDACPAEDEPEKDIETGEIRSTQKAKQAGQEQFAQGKNTQEACCKDVGK